MVLDFWNCEQTIKKILNFKFYYSITWQYNYLSIRLISHLFLSIKIATLEITRQFSRTSFKKLLSDTFNESSMPFTRCHRGETTTREEFERLVRPRVLFKAVVVRRCWRDATRKRSGSSLDNLPEKTGNAWPLFFPAEKGERPRITRIETQTFVHDRRFLFPANASIIFKFFKLHIVRPILNIFNNR